MAAVRRGRPTASGTDRTTAQARRNPRVAGAPRSERALRAPTHPSLEEMEVFAQVESTGTSALEHDADMSGWTLARGHAPFRDPVALSACLGAGDRFDRAVARFSLCYAKQSARDDGRFVGAVRAGRLKATEGV